MHLSCNFVNVYPKLVCIKSPKCHVLLADVVVLLFLIAKDLVKLERGHLLQGRQMQARVD